MNPVFHHYAKRAADVAVLSYKTGKPDGNHELPHYAIVSLVLTGVLFVVGLSMVS